jgi:hypothetical protein
VGLKRLCITLRGCFQVSSYEALMKLNVDGTENLLRASGEAVVCADSFH